MSMRLVVAVALLGLLAGGLWWSSTSGKEDGAIGAGTFTAYVVGPEGTVLASGAATARATPFHVLEALAKEQGFTVEVEQQPWVGGGCTATYVVGIAGQRESTTGGWNYYTRKAADEAWKWGASGAACHRLAEGDQVEWCWVESDVCRHHVP